MEMVQLVDKFKEISGPTPQTKILQDSSFSLDLTNSTYRVSLSPGFQFGECAVLRIINNEDVRRSSDSNCLTAPKPISAGPWTKSRACSLLRDQRFRQEHNASGMHRSDELQRQEGDSIENPPERILLGVVHEAITSKYGWKDAIKGAMREDPDVILVGEIRDHESATLAIEASQTGHLVLSTLHTNNVPATVTRLLTLGIEKHLIADSLLFISAQRLLKALCSGCKERVGMYYRKSGVGCPTCQGTGYSGRVPILEYCLTPDSDLIFNFDQKAFERILKQDLSGETIRLVEQGIVDHRLATISVQPSASNVIHMHSHKEVMP